MLLERLLPWLGSFRDEIVLVTGASSGIGRETALSFARQGARVALAARRREQLREVAKAIEEAGGEALVVPTDVSDPRSVRACVSAVRRKWDQIDILVNNAGILIPSTVAKLKTNDFEAMFRVNVVGSLLMMQAVVPVMQRQQGGAIINVASLAGRRGLTPLGGYCATKFALVGLTEALRTELDGSNIHAGLVLPGVVDTPMAHNVEDAVPSWPSRFNMPPEWVAAAVILAARFRLREVSVPPGSATLEIIASLAPGVADALIGWASVAGRLISGDGTGSGKAAVGAGRRRRTRKQTEGGRRKA